MIESRRLRSLLAVADTGSLAAAADLLGYTPSAVSQQLRALEREAGAVLVERRGRGIRLTEPGRALAAHAERIVDALAAAEAEVQAISGLRAGTLHFGWFSTAGAILVPRAIARFRERHPDIELVLEEADPHDCVRLLGEGTLDLAVVYAFRRDEPLPPGLRLRRLLDDQLYVALPRGHRLVAQDVVHLSDLADETWIQGVRRGPTLSTLPDACREAGFEPQVAFRTDDPLAWQGLVAAGVGVAVLPQLIRPIARTDIAVRELIAPTLARTVSVAMPPGRYVSPAARAMADALQAAADELLLDAGR